MNGEGWLLVSLSHWLEYIAWRVHYPAVFSYPLRRDVRLSYEAVPVLPVLPTPAPYGANCHVKPSGKEWKKYFHYLFP